MAWPWPTSGSGRPSKRRGLLDQAITAYRQAVELQPAWPAAYDKLLGLLARMGRLDEAVAEYEARLLRDPDDALAHYLLARAHSRERRWEGAAAHFSRVLALKATFPEVLVNRGAAYQALGRWAEAVADYSRAIERNPNDADTHNNLAWLLAVCPDPAIRDAAEAVRLAKAAVALKPGAGIFWNTLGVAHYRTRSWDAAVEALEKAMGLRAGGDGLDWFFLGMAHRQLGHEDEARLWYGRAVEWMDKNKPKDAEMLRFRAEASELMGIEPKTP